MFSFFRIYGLVGEVRNKEVIIEWRFLWERKSTVFDLVLGVREDFRA